jgi:mycoredoxin
MTEPEIILYGTAWCGGTRRARLLLDQHDIPYRWVDIETDEAAARALEGLAGGYRSVPTLVWPDGSALVEPSNDELAKKLGITLR